ncbi:DUF3575 domain-containing protein [Pedobacter immunditicola]|uniref:DUF3575 domain-containing protein n=1 Tax=Pedobacter immunditicola TaxID=3133440 RepID=UPI0030A6DF3A
MKSTIILLFSLIIGYSTSSAQEITKQEKGYFNLTEVGYFFSRNIISQTPAGGAFSHKNGAHALSLRNINGFFIGNNLSLGIGVGLDGYTFNGGGSRFDNTFLVFSDVRYYLHNEKNTFFGYGDLGSSVSIDDNIAQGLFYNIGMGYKFMVATRTGMNASFGYNHQKINHDSSNLKESYSSLALKVGLMF